MCNRIYVKDMILKSTLSAEKPLQGLTYWQRAFGCQMNENDAERVSGMLEEAGALPVLTVEEADIVVFLTCCVRERAEIRFKGQVSSIKNIPDAHDFKRIIAVGGCIGQNEGQALHDSLQHVDIVFGTHNLGHLISLIEQHIATGKPQVEILEENDGFSSDLPKRATQPWHAWIPIMTGCNNFCSYCIVPYVRGRESSRTIEDIEAEFKKLAGSGVREVTLLGQNVNSYGRDLYGEPRFAKILEIAGNSDVDRVRFITSHPKDLLPQTIEAMAKYENIMPQLHLPLQSGSNRILKLMNRYYTVEDYLQLVDQLRCTIPDISLSTDIIIGFPGETEEDFLQTLEVAKQVGYGQMYRFIYSKRSGTPAATMPDDTLKEVLQDRFERLEAVAQQSSLNENMRQLNKVLPVLIEGASKRDTGVIAGKSPELQTVHARITDNVSIDNLVGTIIDVRIDDATTNYLQGTIV